MGRVITSGGVDSKLLWLQGKSIPKHCICTYACMCLYVFVGIAGSCTGARDYEIFRRLCFIL